MNFNAIFLLQQDFLELLILSMLCFLLLVRLLRHPIDWLMMQHLPSELLLQCSFNEILVSNLRFESIDSWLWRYSRKVKVYILIDCSFIRNLLKQFLELSVKLFIYNWGISNVKTTFFKAVLNGFSDYILPCGLKLGDRFQYMCFLDYLRCCFSFIDSTNYVTNKQFSVFMLKVPDYTGVKRL